MAKVAISKGHCFRTKGATGTEGEQQFNGAVAAQIAARLTLRGHQAKIFLADESPPVGFDAVLHLHADGSVSRDARGASVGFPDPARYGQAAGKAGQELGTAWKTAYQAHGWARGFRPDNNTEGLSHYYGHQKALDAKIPRSLVIEHGFLTNDLDKKWMLANLEHIGQAHVDAIETVLGHPLGHDDPPMVIAEHPSPVYVVRDGDTLFGISQRLHLKGGWVPLYNKNLAVIGPDPTKIHRGQVLHLP